MVNFVGMKKLFAVFLLVPILSGCFMFSLDSRLQRFGSDEAVRNIGKSLSALHVDVYRRFDRISLLLPSNHFFENGSANFTDNAYESLQLILVMSKYLKDRSMVSVTGYSHGKNNYAKALAIKRACRVASYLWKIGIDATFMYADAKDLRFSKFGGGCLSGCVLLEFLY